MRDARKFSVFLFALLFAVSTVYSLPAKKRGKLALDYRSSVQDILSQFEKYLSLPKGRVSLVKGDVVWAVFGDVKRVKPGYEFVVYKPGKPFKDPDTGMVFPGIDVEVGVVRIKEVKGKFAIGRVVYKKEPVKKGYILSPPDEVRIVLLPVENKTGDKIDTEKLRTLIKLIFMEEPGFTVYDDVKKARGYFFVVKPVLLRDSSGKTILSFVFSSGVSQSPLFALNSEVKLVRAVSSTELLEAQESEEGAGQWGKFAGLITTRVFKAKYKLIAAGDVNGDGSDEVVLAADGLVDVYSIEGKEFKKILTYSWGGRGRLVYKFIWLDVADINGNGIPEIYISAVEQDIVNGVLKAYPSSFVLEYDKKKGKLFKVAKISYLVRVIKNTSNPQGILLAQEMGEYEPFKGFPFYLVYEKGRYRADRRVPPFIKAMNSLYGWTYDDVNGDGKLEIVLIDDGFLRIVSEKGEPIWESPDTLGKFTHLYFYQTPRFFTPPTDKNFDPIEVAKKRTIERRVLTKFCESDGKMGIFTIENDVPGFFIAGIHIETDYTGINGRVVKIEEVSKGTVYGSYYDVLWETPKYKTIYGEDFAIGDFDRDGVLDVAFLGYLKRKGKVRIDVYKIPGM